MTLEAIRGEAKIAGLVSKHGMHQTLINTWKRQAIEGMAGVISRTAEVAAADREGDVETLYAEIGQLLVERDCLAKGEPAKAPPVRARWRADEERVPEV